MKINETYENIKLKIFDKQLADAARKHLGPRCPCCRKPMVKPRKKNPHNMRRRDQPTVAHHIATSMSGNPVVWVYACAGCNSEQGQRNFVQWANDLDRKGDERAGYVRRLAGFVEAWCERYGVPLTVKKSARAAVVQEDEV